MKKNSICYDCKFAREMDGKFFCIHLNITDRPQTDCDQFMPPVGRYDGICTAMNLIREVMSHGLSTQQHDINHIADIFVRSSVSDLAAIANSEEEISGKRVSDTFYFIAFHIWNWREATAFFNEHTNPVTKNHRVADLEGNLKAVEKERDTLQVNFNTTSARAKEYAYKLDDSNAEKSALASEILTLKAKLYDLMTATTGA